MRTVLTVTEYYWLQRTTGYRVLSVTMLFPSLLMETSFKSNTDSRFTSYRVFPVTEEIAGDKLVGQETSSEKFLNQLVTEPTDRVLGY